MFSADTLKLLGAVAGVVTAYTAILWAVFRPHFRDAVLTSLKANRAAFKEWNDETYGPTLEEIVATSTLAQRTHDQLVELATESRQHRDRVETALVNLGKMPQALEHIASAVANLNTTVERITAEHQASQVELAVLRDRVERG